MDDRKSGLKTRHIFAVTIALTIGGLFVWIVQLARQGDPVGYIILTGSGVLICLLVVGLVLRLVMAGTNQPPRQQAGSLKTVYDTQRVLTQQNRALLHQLDQLQKNPALLPDQAGRPASVELGPGQMMTAEGFVIDGTAFDVLDEE